MNANEDNANINCPILALTMGDPAGVGPEIIARALSHKNIYEISRPLVIGDASIISKAVDLIGKPIMVNAIDDPLKAQYKYRTIDVLDQQTIDLQTFEFAKISATAGNAAFEAIHKAIELALNRIVNAVVTAPINKEALNAAGHKFSGHTEIFAYYTNTKNYAMMLVTGNLKVVHVSTHVSLREACELVKKDRVLSVIKLAHSAIQDFGIQKPRIAVSGLNPHSSDGGLFGSEEKDEIIPAIIEAQRNGINVEGPISPDTLYSKAAGGCYDIVVAMYHDQGHIPAKMIGFVWDNISKKWEKVSGINITLGLPIIRTSVDHGTAFDQAWKNIACEESMLEAISYASIYASRNIRPQCM